MDRYARSVEADAMHTRPSNAEVPQGEVNSRLEQKRIDYSKEKKKTLQARYIYGIIFLIINLKAWFFRDYGQKVLSHFNSELARVGAGIFLVLQLVSVIEFITWWNNYWMPDEQEKKSCSLGLFISTVFYIATVCGIVVMYALYGRRLECSLNIFFITWTAILLIVMMAMSLHSKVNRGLLSSGIMASYLAFLCWSAIRSEPASDNCNKQKANGDSDWTTILVKPKNLSACLQFHLLGVFQTVVSFLFAIGAIVMATFSTGIDSQSFQFRKDHDQREDDIPYDYGFFHLVFAFGAMYFAMLFISWNLKNSATKFKWYASLKVMDLERLRCGCKRLG
ncbi:unnamed protein product [Dovyalis caffra]|uniref:Serine incorporator n=1 Tax=Dovyalis caffra TaxID=77055 RepID=A0AAV1RJZ9_9ROSI|nr:unnamed protein product [Dovyalis caffra]